MTTKVAINKKIPARWRNYNPCGVPIQGERIIAFKTPLSRRCDSESDQYNEIKPRERFTPMDLVNHLSQKHVKLGMVVDLTNTDRYYNHKEFSDQGIPHHKIKCVGTEIPNENVVTRFKTEVCSFLDKESDSDAVVGVHCTHGLNRSGYVVCRYLIECRGYTSEAAIKAFNEARGHHMERENYLKDLREKIPKFDFTSFVRVRDNGKQDEIQFDRPRHLYTNPRYATRKDAFEEDVTNWRSPNHVRENTNGYNNFRPRYQQVDRYQSTSNPTQRRNYQQVDRYQSTSNPTQRRHYQQVDRYQSTSNPTQRRHYQQVDRYQSTSNPTHRREVWKGTTQGR
nr:RNA/RNP complex-1-interacting phosphatase homolog [Pocillopora verrucosa]